MRSMWKGSIGFGLVNIPVRLYTATEESTISFSQYDKKDHAKVRYKKVNENSGKELQIPETEVKKDELKMASMLISQLTRPFKADEYRDTYSEKLMKVIEAKARGKATAKPLKVVHNATTSDLMEKLKASLNSKRKKAS